MKTIIAIILLLALSIPAYAGEVAIGVIGAVTKAPTGQQVKSAGLSVGYDFGPVQLAAEYMKYEKCVIEWSQAVDHRADPLAFVCEATVETAVLKVIGEFKIGTAWTLYGELGAGYAFWDFKLRGSTTAHINVFPFPTFHIPLEQSESWPQREVTYLAGFGGERDLGFILPGLSAKIGLRYQNLGEVDPPDITVARGGYSRVVDIDNRWIHLVQVLGGLTYRFNFPW